MEDDVNATMKDLRKIQNKKEQRKTIYIGQ